MPFPSNRITHDRDICHGKPVVRGMRYPVETVFSWLESGMSEREILSDFPDLEIDDLKAVREYAEKSSR